MNFKKRKGLLLKVIGAVLLCAGGCFADYIEGTDTTDVNGYSRDSAFRVQNGSITGQSIVRYWYSQFGLIGYFNYSFDDIKMAADTSKQSPTPTGTVFYCFVIKKNKDSTYSKVQLLQQISGNRYVYKYGTNTTPNNRMLIMSGYDSAVLYKPNNFYNRGSPYPYTWDSSMWEPPLPSKNHLLGYIFYRAKVGVTIDTTAPINLAQWDSIAFFTSTKVNFGSIAYQYFNIVAVYSEGKSAFLTGWTFGYPADGIKKTSSALYQLQDEINIKKTSGGIFITLPTFTATTGPSSLAVFNASGAKVAQFSVSKGNSVLWKTDKLAEGTYLIKAELPDRSVLTRTVVLSR